MIRPQTQTEQYWSAAFTLTDSDIEQVYNHLIEAEIPRTTEEIARVVIAHRVARERQGIQRRLADRTLYEPARGYKKGEALVFPALDFANGKVVAIRDGQNPQYGAFKVIGVEMDGKTREFAAELSGDHALNLAEGETFDPTSDVEPEELFDRYGDKVVGAVREHLTERPEFIQLGGQWFVKDLMAEVTAGHLHLAEAILEMNGGGPLKTGEIMVELDMDTALKPAVTEFSLNYAMLNDSRFDEVAPAHEVAWYLRRLEPEGVQTTPDRLVYNPIPYDRALLSPQLRLLEQELDDEWSDLSVAVAGESTTLALNYPHRAAGTLPLSARVRALFPLGHSPRQRFTLIDEHTGERLEVWVVQEGRYIYGLSEWYEKNGLPIGGYINLKVGPDPQIIFIGFDRRRAQREWVRLASVTDGRIAFEHNRRAVAAGYDDLLIVGTDYVAAIDALWRQAEQRQRSLASLLAEIFPELGGLNPQNTVHAKTLYSALNMLRRVPPGPVFAELVRQPAFVSVGDHYWKFDSSKWQAGRH